jgi:N-acetylmuramic acid 6-phosphate etherase
MNFMKTTEQASRYRHLEKMSLKELLTNMNNEDKTVPQAVKKAIPQIERLVTTIVDKMLAGGRLFYVGAGTSGRLGIIDASECPPTYGVPDKLVIAIMAGGDKAIRKSIEHAEDDIEQGWLDLVEYKVGKKDVVIGIAASGTTPYVVGALVECHKHGITTGSICCNKNAPLSMEADFPVEVIVGPEFVTGSTRMKSGTAQKLVLNMISTSVMIQLGRVEDNRMVDMMLTNNKLIDRGVKMIMQKLNIEDYTKAKKLLTKYKSVRLATEMYLKNK